MLSWSSLGQERWRFASLLLAQLLIQVYLVACHDDVNPLTSRRKPIKRQRRSINSLRDEYGSNFRRAYRMTFKSFMKLHGQLAPYLSGPLKDSGANGPIPSEIRLAIALRYFAGGSMWDIIISHGVSYTEVYERLDSSLVESHA